VRRYLEIQKRYSRLTEDQIEGIQIDVDRKWSRLVARSKAECEPADVGLRE